MPIKGQGWELHLVRKEEQKRPGDGKRRTVGRYQVYHDGQKAKGWWASGMTAESRSPGDNKTAGNGLRVEAGTYPLATQMGSKYVTLAYSPSLSPRVYPKPGIELLKTGARQEILIHPGIGFLASIGCINLCTSLPGPLEYIDYERSRERVIAVIDDMKAFIAKFPTKNGFAIPGATVVIDGEPVWK